MGIQHGYSMCGAEILCRSMIAIDTIAVENEVARNMYERSELDYLIYNAPLEYAGLVLNGDPRSISQSSSRVQTA